MKPSKKISEWEFGHDPGPKWAELQMKELVTELNRTPVTTHRASNPEAVTKRLLPLSEMQIELRRLVQAWMESGPNLKKMFAKEPALHQRTRHGTTLFYAIPDGRGYLEWSPLTPEAHLSNEKIDFRSPADRALMHFMVLITNPFWASLAGPCKRCDKYFIKKEMRERVYCTKTCGSTTTAIPWVKKHRASVKADMLARARASIRRYSEKRRWSSCEKWVRADAGVTQHWLSRAVNQGLLRIPKTTKR